MIVQYLGKYENFESHRIKDFDMCKINRHDLSLFNMSFNF